MATVKQSIDLTTATAAFIDFNSIAQGCDQDSIEVVASADGGASWTTILEIRQSASWIMTSVSLQLVLGRSGVLVGFRFFNGGADFCGVEMAIDSIKVRVIRPG